MTALLDTSVVVRYLTGDPPHLLPPSRSLIDGGDALALTGVAILETAHVLTSAYQVPRDVIVDSLIALLTRENIDTFGAEKDRVIEGLLMCRPSGRVSFGDALIWAEARSTGARTIYSFDRRFPNDGVRLVSPGS